MDRKSWTLENAQKIADEFPYTFYKPSKEVVSKLQPGNQAKLIFQFDSDDPEAPRAQRMWVEIVEITEHGFRTSLDNQPASSRICTTEIPSNFKSAT